MNENESIEFKENYTEKIYKEIIAFLNTNSGTIYIGYDDNGNLIGVDNCKDIEEKISNGIRTNIYPDARIFVSINTGKIEDKEYIIIKVSKGIDIYYLKEKEIVIGSGLRRVKSYYNKIGLNFEIDVLPSTFVVKLPKISLNNVAIQNNSKGDMDIIIKYIEKNGSITRINAQALINKEKTTTSTILNKLVENGVLVKIGNGPSTRYEINK